MISGKIRAWIKAHEGGPGVVVAFVGVADGSDVPLRRSPARRVCPSHEEGKRWVESEARALGGIPVEWVSEAPGD